MIREDMSDSARDFISIVWPCIKKCFNNCEIRHVESFTSKGFVKELDTYAGIDAWILNRKKGMRGLASRIQWGTKWDSFTIRYKRKNGVKTEYEKRIYAISNGWEYPYYTVQAYISDRSGNGNLLGVALCKTKDLFLFIKNGKEGEDFYIKETGNAYFCIIYWDHFNKFHKLKTWDNKIDEKGQLTTEPVKEPESLSGNDQTCDKVKKIEEIKNIIPKEITMKYFF